MDLHFPDLLGWLTSRRWFAAKDAPPDAAEITAVVPLEAEGSWLAVVRTTRPGDRPGDRWLLCLTAVDAGDSRRIGSVDGVAVADLGDAPEAAVALVRAIERGKPLDAVADFVVRVEREATRSIPADGPARLMGVEQSNTSVVLDEAVVVKVVRKLLPGPNPEIELTAALTRAGVAGVPPLVGALVGPEDEALVVLSAYVAGAAGAWELAVEEAAGREHGVLDGMESLGGLLRAVHEVLHRLGTRMLTRSDLRAIGTRLREDLAATATIAEASGMPLPDTVHATVSTALAAAATTLRDGVELQRIHGDFHLGQVIRHPDGSWRILDFEGEPGRSMAQRRQLAHPMYDVAGMTRSIDYARASAVRQGGDTTRAREWARTARRRFLRGYGEVGVWHEVLELDKLLYEVRYEAANRPDWLPIPLRALGGIDLSDDLSEDATMTDKNPVPPAASQEEPEPRPEPRAQPDAAPPPSFHVPLHDPHSVLGAHPDGDRWVVRARRPLADSVALLVTADAEPIAATHVGDGVFEARCAQRPDPGAYRWRVTYGDTAHDIVDPYAFEPTLGEVDLHLLAEGRHEQAWEAMGARRRTMHGIDGVSFTVWAPNARGVSVVGDFNSWDDRLHAMRSLGASGIWEVFAPDVEEGARYKLKILSQSGEVLERADPWARWTETPPSTASRVFTSQFGWQADPIGGDPLHEPMSVYEVHLGSWRRNDDGTALGYRQIAKELAAYVSDLGFTHVEFLPPAEHPFGGSWGYQVTGHFAPTSRFGSPDDFRYVVDTLHEAGIGVLVDWVPAHFPKDEWALARFDGTALYEHEDPRLGEHPDWGTLVFNYGRREVRNFLLASALFWLEELRIDGLRVDAVASMLYLDYSREDGQWLPNEHGGRENLRAVELLQEVNATVYKRNPHAFTVAEESTAWPGVSRPTHLGGLGFGFKWNMGWMHDTLSYFSKEPIYRRWHHNQLTFGLMYAFSENFVLPLSHDEVVHGKGSLLGKMPGDDWQRHANLRALYAWMWGHPGKQLLFMGGEIAQDREWSEERQLDWYGLDQPLKQGVQSLVRDLNTVYRDLPALWRRDNQGAGFRWIDANNADDNLLSFLRFGDDDDPPVAVIANLSPVPRYNVRIGLPQEGHWREALNTDAEHYGGGNVGNLGGVESTGTSHHGLPASAAVTLPPLGVVWLVLDD